MKEKAALDERIGLAERASDLSSKIEATQRILDKKTETAATATFESSPVVNQTAFVSKIVSMSLTPDEGTQEGSQIGISASLALANVLLTPLCFLVAGRFRKRSEEPEPDAPALDVPARSLVLEIPEPGITQGPPGFLGMLARLRIHGFGLALEHFGSGNSSLADLYRTPFSDLKIDRRLVGLVDEDEDARRLVRGIILLAHELGLQTTAEAVETPGALEFLHESGCDRVQGYVISRPLPANEFQAVAAHWL